jgi:hypothetical protein
MHTLVNYILWLLAGIAGVAFGIFFASSLDLHEPLYIFLLAGLFGIAFVVISYRLTKLFIIRIKGRMMFFLAGLIILAAITASAFLLIEAYASR